MLHNLVFHNCQCHVTSGVLTNESSTLYSSYGVSDQYSVDLIAGLDTCFVKGIEHVW